MIPRMKHGLFPTLGLLAAATLISCTPYGPEKYSVKMPEEFATLDNGLRVIVLPDPSTPLVEVDVHYEVGAKIDRPLIHGGGKTVVDI